MANRQIDPEKSQPQQNRDAVKKAYRPSPLPAAPAGEDGGPSKMRRLAAGVFRVGTGSLGQSIATRAPGWGTVGGGAIGALGEMGAQKIEGDKDITDRESRVRQGIAGGLSAIPGGAFFKEGKVVQSALRSGGITGGSELLRQKASGEDTDLLSAGLSALIGGGSGALIGRLTRKAISALPSKPFGPNESLDQYVKSGKWSPEDIDKQAARYDALKDHEAADAIRKAATLHDKGTTGTYKDVDRANIAAQKAKEKLPVDISRAEEAAFKLRAGEKVAETKAFNTQAEEAAKLKEVQDTITAEGLEPKPPTVSKSVSAKDPSGRRLSKNTRYTKPPDEADEAAESGGKSTAAPRKRAPKGPKGGATPTATAPPTTPTAVPSLEQASAIAKQASDADLNTLLANKDIPEDFRAVIETELASRMLPQSRAAAPIAPKGVPPRPDAPVLDEAAQIAAAGGRRTAQAAEHAGSEKQIEEMLARNGVTDDTPASALPYVATGELPPSAIPMVERRTLPDETLLGGRRGVDPKIEKTASGAVRKKGAKGEAPSEGPPDRRTGEPLLGGRRVTDPKVETQPSGAIRKAGTTGITPTEGPSVPSVADKAQAVSTKALPGTQFARFLRTPEQAAQHASAQQAIPYDSPAGTALHNLWAQADVAKGTARKPIMAKIQGVRKGFGLQAGPKAEYTLAQKAAQEGLPSPTAETPLTPPSPEKQAAWDAAMSKYPAQPEITDPQAIARAEQAADQEQISILKATPKGGPKIDWQRPEVPQDPPPTKAGTPGAMTPEEYQAKFPDTFEEGPPAVPGVAPEASQTAPAAKAKGKAKAAAPIAPKPAQAAPAASEGLTYKIVPKGQQIFVEKSGSAKPFGPFKSPEEAMSWVQRDEARSLAPEKPGFSNKPRLVKKPAPGGDETGAINPSLAVHLGLGAGGALAGAALNPDDPLTGAAIGGLAGVSAPTLVRGLASVINNQHLSDFSNLLRTPEGVKQAGKDFYHLIPHIQRFNYLFSASGLPANAFVGPTGSGLMGALTKALSGDERGYAAIRELMDPSALKQSWTDAGDQAMADITRAEAGDPLFRAELGGAVMEKLPQEVRERLQWPGRLMHQGDLTVRNILKKHGFTEAEAREMTLTAEPYIAFLKKLSNLRRGDESPLMNIVAPFVKTPANIVEQGLLGIPGVGFAAQAARETGGAAPMAMREQFVRQGVGSVVGILSYFAGVSMDPENARIARRLITNAAGPYSLVASLGFAAGQSVERAGVDPLSTDAVGAAASMSTANEFTGAFPLPAMTPVSEAAGYVLGNRTAPPSGTVPGIVKDVAELAGYNEPRVSPQLPRYRNNRQQGR